MKNPTRRQALKWGDDLLGSVESETEGAMLCDMAIAYLKVHGFSGTLESRGVA